MERCLHYHLSVWCSDLSFNLPVPLELPLYGKGMLLPWGNIVIKFIIRIKSLKRSIFFVLSYVHFDMYFKDKLSTEFILNYEIFYLLLLMTNATQFH